MSGVVWSDAEREAVGRALYLQQARMHVHPDDVVTPEGGWDLDGLLPNVRSAWLAKADAILDALAPHVAARAAQAAAKGEERATDEYDALLTLQSDLLEATVNVLRGDPPELTQWSHHDVADRAQRLKSEHDVLAERLAQRSEALDRVVAENERLTAMLGEAEQVAAIYEAEAGEADERLRLLNEARAKVARVEALVDEGGHHWDAVDEYAVEGLPCVSVDNLRAALAGEPS